MSAWTVIGVIALLLPLLHRCRCRRPAKAAAPKTPKALAGRVSKPVEVETPPAAPDTSSVGAALLVAWMFYLTVFHFLSNMPLNDKLLYGVHQRYGSRAARAAERASPSD